MILTNPLDIWIVSRLHQLIAEVERGLDNYNLPDATADLPFLDDASTTGMSDAAAASGEDDGDKMIMHAHYVLRFQRYAVYATLAEELYHNLTGDNESIILKIGCQLVK